MNISIDTVKLAKDLLDKKITAKDIEEQTGLKRAGVKDLVYLYDLMNSQQTISGVNSDYVRIKKKRYMMKSIKLQHRMSDMRVFYLKQLEVLKNKRKNIRKYLDVQEEVVDLKREIYEKQKMLNVTSSNLQHAEDGYEYIKQEWIYSKALYFLIGISFVMFVGAVFNKFFGQINIVY